MERRLELRAKSCEGSCEQSGMEGRHGGGSGSRGRGRARAGRGRRGGAAIAKGRRGSRTGSGHSHAAHSSAEEEGEEEEGKKQRVWFGYDCHSGVVLWPTPNSLCILNGTSLYI